MGYKRLSFNGRLRCGNSNNTGEEMNMIKGLKRSSFSRLSFSGKNISHSNKTAQEPDIIMGLRRRSFSRLSFSGKNISHGKKTAQEMNEVIGSKRPSFSRLSFTYKSEKKSVRFSPIIDITEIPCPETEAEKSQIWYDKSFFEYVQKNVRQTIQLVLKGQITDEENDEYCFAGLEQKTFQGAIRRASNISKALHAVLDEQDRQLQQLTRDPNLLAMVYVQYSSQCSKHAIQKALSHHKAVSKY